MQAFIFVLRRQLYEFYGFSSLEDAGVLHPTDFAAIEDDALFLIHQKVVCKEVHENLIILSRLLKNVEDREIRAKYRDIGLRKGEFFPLERRFETIAER